MSEDKKPANNSAGMFGLDEPNVPTDWRGIPIEKVAEEIKQTTRDSDGAPGIEHKANIDAEGAD